MDAPAHPEVFDGADAHAVAHFERLGWVLTRTLDDEGVAALRRWVDDIAAWPDGGGDWIHHREMTDDGPRLCRSEHLIEHHDELRRLLTSGAMLDTASALLGEPAVLYKEKINYKAAGGAGYAPHQDAPAYPFVARHVSCMISVDDATLGNGCLDVVSSMHQELLETDDEGCIAAPLAESMRWTAVEVPAGQTLWFHSLTPHRSAANRSERQRRALYPTYNARAEGDLRRDYYRKKLATFASGASGRDGGGAVRVSLINDFQGRPVP